MFLDVQMMLFGGFGFLMTFLRRFGFSSVAFTMLITVICVEWGILVSGLMGMGEEFAIRVGMFE